LKYHWIISLITIIGTGILIGVTGNPSLGLEIATFKGRGRGKKKKNNSTNKSNENKGQNNNGKKPKREKTKRKRTLPYKTSH